MSSFDDDDDDYDIPEPYTQEEQMYDDSDQGESRPESHDESGRGEDRGGFDESGRGESREGENPDRFEDLSETDDEDEEELLKKQRILQRSQGRGNYVLKRFMVRGFGVVKIRFGKKQWKNARFIRKYQMNSVNSVTTRISDNTLFIGYTLEDTIDEFTFDIYIYIKTSLNEYIERFKEFLKKNKVIKLLNKDYEWIYLDLQTPNKKYRVSIDFPEEFSKVVDSYKFKLKDKMLENLRGEPLLVSSRTELPKEAVIVSLTTRHFIVNESIKDKSYDKDYIKCRLLKNKRALLVYINPLSESERMNILRTKKLKLRVLDGPSGTKDLEINKASLYIEEYFVYKNCEVQVYNGEWYKVVMYANNGVYSNKLAKREYHIEPVLYMMHEMEELRNELKRGMESHARIHKLESDPFFVKKGDNNLHIKLEHVDKGLLKNIYFNAGLNNTMFSETIKADDKGYFDIGDKFQKRHLKIGYFEFMHSDFREFNGKLHIGSIYFRNRRTGSKPPSKKRFGKVVFEYFKRQ